MDMVRFSNTGTEANSYAIHTARAVTGRNKIVMYDGAYHGAWIHGGKAAGHWIRRTKKSSCPMATPNSLPMRLLQTPRTSLLLLLSRFR